jgi:O-acetyl-ADP-ribose deacetylase (regulator of RNase III)
MIAILSVSIIEMTPDSWLGKALIALASTAVISVLIYLYRRIVPRIPGTPEYRERLKAQEIEDAAAKQNNDVVFSRTINNTNVKLFSGDITRSTAQAIVSSDDTLLSATGGVAKSIVRAAGASVQKRLRALSANNIPRGSIAVTSAGRMPYKYILHAIVLTKARDHTDYPSKEEIIRLVRRIVEVSDALGIESFALPLLAGGTAAKKLREEGLASDQDIIQFILMALFEALAKRQNSIKSVFLVVFDNRHLTDGLLAKL